MIFQNSQTKKRAKLERKADLIEKYIYAERHREKEIKLHSLMNNLIKYTKNPIFYSIHEQKFNLLLI
jgi:hypothetical protein